MQADPHGFVAHLHAYQDAINRAVADATAAHILDVSRIEEKGVQYPSVRAVLDYLVGEHAHIDLSDFHIRGQQVTCIYHEVSELDRVVGYPGSRRQAVFTFSQEHIATLVIHRLDPQERQDAQRLITPFSPGSRPAHPAKWIKMSQLSFESGATLARMARAWAASQSSP